MSCACKISRLLNQQELADIKALVLSARGTLITGDIALLLEECPQDHDQCEYMLHWGFQRYCFSPEAIKDFVK